MPSDPMQTALQRISDAVGQPLGRHLDVLVKKGCQPRIAASHALTIPLQMSMSHMLIEEGEFMLGCWKLSEGVYLAACYEIPDDLTTVMLYDKAKIPKKSYGQTLAGAVLAYKDSHSLDTIDDYFKFVGSALLASWSRVGEKGQWMESFAD